VVLLFLILSVLLIYYLTIKNSITRITKTPTTKEAAPAETVIDNAGNTRKIRKQYPTGANTPGFIVYRNLESSDDDNTGYDFYEQIGIRVVSTGELSHVAIRSQAGAEELAEVIQLRVYVDDTDGYLTSNEPFNIALEVLKGDKYKTDIAPIYLSQAAIAMETNRLFDEIDLYTESGAPSEENLEIVNEKLRTYSGSLRDEGIPENMLKTMFAKDSRWVITPFISFQDGFTDKRLSSEYKNLIGNYYEGGYSNFLTNILDNKVVSGEEPVLITDLFLGSD